MKSLLATAVATVGLVLVPAAAASAHPLGNFTVNHYDGLTLHPQGVDVLAVVDAAEIPTAQAKPTIDGDGNGVLSPAERAAFALRTCRDVAAAQTLTVRGTVHRLTPSSWSYQLRPGAAGLPTSRLSCALHAAADLRGAASRLTFEDDYDGDRIGWREITVVAAGVHVRNSPVPARSVSDELRHYPNDLLSSPLDVRRATLSVFPGAGASTFARSLAKVPVAGPVARFAQRVNRVLNSLAGAHHLTVAVGALAVLVALLLGAMHAALPGHGKTVVAAYLAGKRGRTRDALLVGATVTATHTGGVLLVGLALTASASLAGERLLADLGVASGVLVLLVGAGLLLTARRRRPRRDHAHTHPHHTDDPHAHRHDRMGLIGMGVAGGLVPSPSALVVLLGALALGRTAFGVALVLTYGLGMAATLTLAGLIAVRVSERARQRWGHRAVLTRLGETAPILTGSLVMIVGLGLTVRSILAI